MKTALVTGATGYIGGRLVDRLLKEGVKVSVVSRVGSPQGRLESLPVDVFSYSADNDGLRNYVASIKPETTFHLAAANPYRQDRIAVDDLINGNILFGTHLLAALAETGPRKFINAGTYWQHFMGSMDYQPATLYAASKKAFQDIVTYYAQAKAVSAMTLILFDVYGPKDGRGKLFNQLRAAKETGSAVKLSPGKQLVDLVYIDDVIDAFWNAGSLIERDPSLSGASFDVATGEQRTLRDVVACYERLSETAVPVEWGGRAYRPREVMKPYSGQLLPKWKPSYLLEQGIARMLNIDAGTMNEPA